MLNFKKKLEGLEVENKMAVGIASTRVWDLVKDFRNLKRLAPGAIEHIDVKNSGINATWQIRTSDGVTIHEKMTEFNEQDMYLAYTMTEGGSHLQQYQASIKVVPKGPATSEVILKATFDVLPEHKQAMLEMINGFQKTYLSNIN